MKKRILALILALITITQMCVFALPVIADDVDGEGTDDLSDIGAIVRFIDINSLVYMYSNVTESAPSTQTTRILPSNLPETFLVLDAITVSYGTRFYKLGTIDGSSNDILDVYPWVKADLMEIVPVPDENFIKGQVDLTDGANAIGELSIAKGEKTSVFTNLGSEIEGTPLYSWQILIDRENNRWANILDYCYPYAVISEALIVNARDKDGKATLRCIVTAGDKKYVSGELTVTLEEPAAHFDIMKASYPPSTYLSGSNDGGVAKAPDGYTEFQIEVNYHFLHATAVNPSLNNSIAGQTVTITLGTGSTYSGTITSPPALGYKPYVKKDMADTLKIEYENEDLVEYPKGSRNYYVYAPEIKFSHQADAIAVMVYYIPQKVNFTVRVYKQNPRDDNYTLADTYIVTNENTVSDSAVGTGLDEAIEGFKPLYYDPNTIISGDGATIIDIYYDREYYRVNFDLEADGGTGYGVVPMYVRYDTQVMIGTPTNPGYTFDGWELTRVYIVDEDSNEETNITDDAIIGPYDIEDGGSWVTVHHNLDYKAKWKISTATYTVIYWRENANDNGFSIWKTETATASSGEKVDVSNKRISDALATTNGVNEKRFFTYNESLSDKSVTVKGDGTAAANIYYTRNVYHIIFQAGTNQGASDCRLTEHTHGTGCCSVGGCDHTGGTCHLTKDCTVEEHIHSDSCEKEIKCGIDEHEHTEVCCLKEPHSHTKDCYDNVGAEYTGNGNNINNNPTSGTVYRTWDWDSYKYYYYIYIAGVWYNYTSTINRSNQAIDVNSSCPGIHTHGDGKCICEKTLHTHEKDCYNYLCGKEEHWHVTVEDCIIYPHKHNGCTRYLYVLSAKYNADISEDWPVSGDVDAWRELGWLNNDIYYQYWALGNTGQWATKRVDMTDELCGTDANNRTITLSLYKSNSGQGQNTVTYMFESIEQTPGGGRVQYGNDGTYYEKSIRYTQEGMVSPTFSPKDILGMTSVNSDSATLYYKRNSYNLVFVNGGKTEKTVSIKYEAPLNSRYYVPDIPSSYEENSVYFAGWYTTQTCADGTEFDFSKEIMPASELYLYAKWAPTSLNVKVYNDKEIVENNPSNTLVDVTVAFGSMIENPTYTKINDNYIFAGWYYVEDGEENRFDFNTMQIKKAYVIYAKWVSKVPVPYTIYYKTNKDGVLVDIAEPTVGQSLAAMSKSFEAKVNEELYEEYRLGYYPTARSVSIMMSAEHANEYTFIYETLDEVTYTVKHTFTDDEFLKKLPTNSFSFSQTYPITEPSNASPLISVYFREMVQEEIVKAEIKKQFPSLSDEEINELWTGCIVALSPDAYLQELILVSDSSQNIIEFDWTNRHESAIYEIVYMIKNLYDDAYSTHMILQSEGIIGRTYSVSKDDVQDDVPGFTFNEEKSTMSAELTRPLTQGGGTTLVLYYDRNMYIYTVDYYKRGTMEKLADTVEKQVLFETVVTETAIDIAGYHVVSASTVTEEITVDKQAIVFYYEADDVTYVYAVGKGKGILTSYGEKVNITKEPKGSIPTPNLGYVFDGWYKDADCTILVTDEDAMVTTTAGSEYGKITPVNPSLAPDHAIYFYAKFVPHKLTIENMFSASVNPDPALDIGDQCFIYIIEGVNDTPTQGIKLRVAVAVGGSQTINGLPAGDYTITVESAWSWRYDYIENVKVDDASLENLQPTDMQWTITFDGSDVMEVCYSVPGPEIFGTTMENSYYYVTDGAYSN